MRNRISHIVSQQLSLVAETQAASQSHSCSKLNHRPTLQLGNSQPITVDMERFFEFSFSFAEALVDLEDRYSNPVLKSQQQLETREQQIRWIEEELDQADRDQDFDCDFEIDARWM